MIGAAFVASVIATWGRFGELVVDTGRELDVPRRLLAGERLYADVRWYYGPLAPWVNTLLYRWFGVHMNVLAGAGIASAAMLTIIIYLLTRRFAGRVASTGAALAFLNFGAFFGNVCGFDLCNFAIPYTYAATYGMLASSASLFFLIRHAQGGRARDFFASAALLAIAALGKLEPLSAALAAHAAFAVLTMWRNRRIGWAHVVGWACAAALVAACYGSLMVSSKGAVWTDLRALANPASSHFIAYTMGIDRIERSVLRALWSLAVFAAAMVTTAASARLARHAAHPLVRQSFIAGPGILVFPVYFWIGDYDAFRALPAVMAAMLVVLGRRWVSRPELRAETLPVVLLWVFGLVALGRIVLRVNLDIYGFYMLPVGLVCLAAFVSEDIPRALRCGAPGRAAFMVTALALFWGTGLDSLLGSVGVYEARTIPVQTPRGTIRLPESQASVAEMARALCQLPPNVRLLSLPEGAGFNFFSGVTAADAMSSHLPMEIPDDSTDQKLVDQLRASPPDFVLVVSREMSEFGYKGFGRDYARRTARWIQQEYRPVLATHPGVVLLARTPPRLLAAPGAAASAH